MIIKVVKTVDGDTIHVLITEQKIEQFFEVKLTTIKETTRILRIRGVDTPERGEVGYKEASDFTRKLLLGKEVEVEFLGKDKYGRDLAHVKIEGKNLADLLLEKNLARIWID